MEAVVELLSGPNGPIVICFVGFALLFGGLLAKRGMLGIHTKYLSIGAKDTEQLVIRNQIETAYLYVMSLENLILDKLSDNPYGGFKVKWVLEKVYDEVVTWIIYNHISDDDDYVQAKCDKMVDRIYNLGVSDEFRTQEFRETMEALTKDLIRKLLRTRRLYEKMEGKT